MPDSIPAVGAEIRPPNPIQTFSNVLGLRQQQLAIQQQQAGVQTLQAEAAQANQKNQELTALHNFTMNAVNNSAYLNTDGTLNTQKFERDAMSVAGTYGQAYIGQALNNANESVQNRKSLLDLSNDQRKTIGGYLGSVAADPNATKKSFLDAIENARGVSSDPSYQRSIDGMLMNLPNIYQMNPAQQSQALRTYARNIAIATESPTASISGPSITLTPGRKPLTTNITQTNPLSPMGTGNVGKSVPIGIGTDMVTQPGTGAPNVVSGTGQAFPIGGNQQNQSPQTPTTQTAKQNWWNPAPFQIEMYKQNVDAMVKRAQSGIQAANTAPQALDALDRMRAILDEGTWTGTAFSGFKDLKNLAASIGLDTTGAQNASELVKNMARYEAARASAVGDTDASRALVEAGSPNFKMDANAVKSVVLQSIGNERIIQSYANLMQSAPNPQVAMQREQQFRSIPHLLQMLELGELHSKPEVDEFLQRYDLSGKELAKSYQMYQQLMATAQNGV